jgi:hypothetical protein
LLVYLPEHRREALSLGFENVLMSTSELLERMLAAGYEGSLREWNKFRNEIVKNFKRVSTTSERVALLRAEENARLRKVNSQMISALEYVLPLLQRGLPATVDFDWTKEAVAKVQDALAEAERD